MFFKRKTEVAPETERERPDWVLRTEAMLQEHYDDAKEDLYGYVFLHAVGAVALPRHPEEKMQGLEMLYKLLELDLRSEYQLSKRLHATDE